MYAISIWLCTMTAWLDDRPYQRVEAFQTQSVCLEFCDKAAKFHQDKEIHDIQCNCELKVVYDHLID